MMVTNEVNENANESYQWAVPEKLELPPDKLVARLDFYENSIILHLKEKEATITKRVKAEDISNALIKDINWSSGLLPEDTLWWKRNKYSTETALWRGPRVWKVAIVLSPGASPTRFKLPMPGLIFVCSPGQAPHVHAAKRRPSSIHDQIYHAPLFNTYVDGRTCGGTHKYPLDPDEIPESFFTAFFSLEDVPMVVSCKHNNNLLELWKEIDGKAKYPTIDLIQSGTIEGLLNKR